MVDLYSVGEEDKTWGSLKEKEVPFMHWLLLHGPRGEVVRVNALFDGGAMVGAMCASVFEKVKHRLHGQATPSSRLLRMANRIVIQSQAVWKGTLELKGIRMEGEFEVFDSGGGWKFLFGKPLLRCFQAVHDYDTDTVFIRSEHGTAILHSSNAQEALTAPAGKCLASDAEQRENSVGGSSGAKPPSRQVLHMDSVDSLVQNDESGFVSGCVDVTTEETGEDVVAMNEDFLQEKECSRAEKNGLPTESGLEVACEGVQESVYYIEEHGEGRGTNQGGDEQPPSREVPTQISASAEAKESDEPRSAIMEYVIDAVLYLAPHTPGGLQVVLVDLVDSSWSPPGFHKNGHITTEFSGVHLESTWSPLESTGVHLDSN